MQTYYVLDDTRFIPTIDGKISSIFFDLENFGKNLRQPSNHIISSGSYDDIPKARELAHNSELLLRLNPINTNTEAELKLAKENDVDIVMLPYFKYIEEVETFCSFYGQDLPVCLLVETPEAVLNLRKILWKLPIARVHFGLNDLRIALGRKNIFEPVFDDCLLNAINSCKEFNIPFGIGGVGRVDLQNPSPEDYLRRCLNLGANWVILNRSFVDYRTSKSVRKFGEIFFEQFQKMEALFNDLEMNDNFDDTQLCKFYLNNWYGE